ncbi:hypothetical protein ABIC02_007835 [Bradyrhizobium sp. RT5a]
MAELLDHDPTIYMNQYRRRYKRAEIDPILSSRVVTLDNHEPRKAITCLRSSFRSGAALKCLCPISSIRQPAGRRSDEAGSAERFGIAPAPAIDGVGA